MEEPLLSVQFYATGSGREPVREFLLKLTAEDRKTIGTDIKTVQFGWPLGMPLVRKMEPGTREIRSHVTDGTARTFFYGHRQRNGTAARLCEEVQKNAIQRIG